MHRKSYRRVPHRLAAASVLLTLLLFTGCFSHHTIIRVNADGSGTIEQEVVLLESMVQMLQMFAPPGQAEDAPLYTLEDLEAEAAAMGEGVTLVSVEPLDTGDASQGYRAIYAFEDVRKLTIEQNAEPPMPDAMSADMPDAAPDAPSEAIQFDFTPGTPAALSIRVPMPDQEDFENNDPVPDSLNQTPPIEMLRGMFEGARISLVVEVDGTITDTDATYRDGDQVVLMDIDFEALLEDPEQFENLTNRQPSSITEAREMLESIDGIKVETQEVIQIRFE